MGGFVDGVVATTWFRRCLGRGNIEPRFRGCGLVDSSGSSQKCRLPFLRRRQIHDDWVLLSRLCAVNGSAASRPTVAKIAPARSIRHRTDSRWRTITWVLAPRVTASLVPHLFFWWPQQMPREWMVERLKRMARADSSPVQCLRSAHSREVEIYFPVCGNWRCAARREVSVFHLAPLDTSALAAGDLWNARGDRSEYGIVSVRARDDCVKLGCFCSRTRT